ncbi:unnamed protein product, partial [marine sediment metagenome]
VKSSHSIICATFDFLRRDHEILNMVDDNNNGEVIGRLGEYSPIGTKLIQTLKTIGTGSYILRGDDEGKEFSQIKFSELPIGTIPDRFTMWGRFAYNNIDACNGRNIFLFEGATDPTGLCLTVRYGGLVQDWHWALQFSHAVGGDSQTVYRPYIVFHELPITNVDEGEVFVCVSMSKGDSVSMFVGNLLTGEFHAQRLDWDSWIHPAEMTDELWEDLGSFSIGYNDYSSGNRPIGLELRICQFQLIINQYYNADNLEDKTAI